MSAELDSFVKARDAILQMWERSERERLGNQVYEEMLVVADALEEAGLNEDAAWLRESYATGSAPNANKLVFIGRTLSEVRRMAPPSGPSHSKKDE